MSAFYPVYLTLRGRCAVVIGGGPVAEQKVIGLLDAEARVIVISPAVTTRLRDLAAAGSIEWTGRPYRRGDLAHAFLAIAATDDRSANHEVWREAEERGVLLNAVDDVDRCHFLAPAIHRQGDLTVAISTGGKGPALAVRLRDRIAKMIGPEYATLLDLLGEARPEVTQRIGEFSARKAFWYRVVDSDVPASIRRGDIAAARARIHQLLDDATDHSNAAGAASREPHARTANPRGAGVVVLVGAGPGDPGLITLRGLEALRQSDVVVYDRLVHPALLDETPATAERVFVGKHAGANRKRQEEINDLLIDRARAGLRVTRLKGGDPFVFGRGGEECEALSKAGIPFEVVPGVTSAVAVPAAAGIPLTDRRYASAFAVVTGHQCNDASALDWDALARIPVLVVLMGLRSLPAIACRLIAHGAAASTPAAVVASGTLPSQRVVVGTLETIGARVIEAALEPPATIIIGDVVELHATHEPSSHSLAHPFAERAGV